MKFPLGRVVSIAIFSFMFGIPNPLISQCTQQPPNNGYSVDPNTIIYVKIDPSFTQNVPPGSVNPSPLSQVLAAMNAWSAANSQPGGSGATFVLADANHNASVIIAADQGTGTTSATTTAYPGLVTEWNPATITFHPDALFASGSPIYDPNAAAYDSAYMDRALHEFAHVNGIGDYYMGTTQAPPPGSNTSVAAPTIGVNAQSTYHHSGPTSCDVQQAAISSQIIINQIDFGIGSGGSVTQPPLPQLDGGAGNGVVVVGGPSCYEWWDDKTGTLNEVCS